MMNWPKYDANTGQYEFPPFEGDQFKLLDSEVACIRDTGFEFVRLTVAPGIFLQSNGTRFEELIFILEKNLDKFLNAGLKVLVDFHPTDQVREYSRINLIREPQGALFQRYIDVIGIVAQKLGQYRSGDVGLELMNEPALEDAGLWQELLRKLYIAARMKAPNLPLIMTGCLYGSWRGLIQLDLAPFLSDTNLLYAFTFYEPFIFSHQGVRDERYFRDIRWPASLLNLRKAQANASSLVDADTSLNILERQKERIRVTYQLQRYVQSASGPQTLHDTFDKVSKWAKTILPQQILITEFGAVRTYGSYQGAPEEDRFDWLSTVRLEAERRGWGWALWAYSGPSSMTFAGDGRTKSLDSTSVRALGLKAGCMQHGGAVH
ncbi:glycoside hydrolase family 5 protein [Bradyrhizobium guangzhouense]|nr:cellulase family glycosylhydrolase [Bradyrhizobium guangzhouense]